MNLDQIAVDQRLVSMAESNVIQDWYLFAASILKRMVTVDHFTLSMSLYCAGVNSGSSREVNLTVLTLLLNEHPSM